jgi:pimeloyl-ACP methyl ester carboxylesterase
MHAALRLSRLTIVACALALAGTTAAQAAPPPPDSVWSQHYIQSTGGVKLHADVLRPKHLPKNAKTPVLLSVGPYFNHSGQTGAVGPVEETPYNPATVDGPSDRFYDYIEGAKVLQRGYTWVQVDLRGFGGSNGCLDWAGPGEQADVKAAVEWAAKQSFSNGKVGMYGKSYDAVTGLIGIKKQPKGLRAVVAQEPVYDLYRYLYMNRTRYLNSLVTPNLYNGIAVTPGPATDQLAYNLNSVVGTPPGCEAENTNAQQEPDHSAPYWKPRNLIAGLRGKRTPLFLTQGLLENNTKPDGLAAAWNAVKGPKRAWLGMWDHVRGNDRDPDRGNRLKMGRPGWFDETMQFYDRYLKGRKARKRYPKIVVGTNDGKWRSETAWPPRDAYRVSGPLRKGTYSDDGVNNGAGDGGTPPYGIGVWTFSRPFGHTVRMSGTPRLTVDTDAAKGANLYVDVYNVSPKGAATLFTRGAYLLQGPGRVTFNLYDQDWKFHRNNRLGVLVTGGQAEWWNEPPSGQQVTVRSASLSMPYLRCARPERLPGGTALRLEDYRDFAPFTVDAQTIKQSTSATFPIAPKLKHCDRPAKKRCRRTMRIKVRQPRHGRIVRATVYVNGRKKLVKRGRRVRRVTLRHVPKGRFRVRIVGRTANGRKVVTVRRFRACKNRR